MILIAWFLSIYGSFYLGYELDKLRKRLTDVEDLVKAYRDRNVVKEQESPSQIIDPDDLAQQVLLEHKRKMKALNPDKDDYA